MTYEELMRNDIAGDDRNTQICQFKERIWKLNVIKEIM